MSLALDQLKGVTVGGTLAREVARMEQERLFQQRLEEALSLGASIEFINHYFGLSTPEVCARRRLIGQNTVTLNGRN